MSGDAALFARMLLIGVVVAAPVGAMGVLCIQRVLAHGWTAGLATGAGIASADAFYASVAAFGLTAVSGWMIDYQAQFRIVGGVALIVLGWRAMVTPTTSRAAEAADSPRLVPLYGSALGLTLTNPMTIMAFAAIFASAGLVAAADARSAVTVTIGVACGSLAWWVLLSTGVWAVRHAVSDRAMIVVNRISGGVIIAFGVLAVATGVGAISG